jgi:hypothetical protein
MDSMNMLRSSTRGDQRIKTCQTRAGHAGHAPKGRGVEGKEKDKESLDGQRRSRELHAGQFRGVDLVVNQTRERGFDCCKRGTKSRTKKGG